MEAIANSVEDKLIEGLSFKSKAGASYITERKSVTFHPQGSNIYSTNGTKLIKILLTGDQFVDPSTFRVAFDVVNMETTPDKKLRVLGGPHTLQNENLSHFTHKGQIFTAQMEQNLSRFYLLGINSLIHQLLESRLML